MTVHVLAASAAGTIFVYVVILFTCSYLNLDILVVVHKHPVSILYKSIAGRYRSVRVADGPITARYRFIKNASWATRTAS